MLKTKNKPAHSSNTYTLIYAGLKGSPPQAVINDRFISLQHKAQLFLNHLLRLLTPRSIGEPHNFIPEYQHNILNRPTLYRESRLTTEIIPFYRIDPKLIAPAFHAGHAKNLGALIFLCVLTNTPLSAQSLSLVQSPATTEYYFTQQLTPSWLFLFETERTRLSFFDDNLDKKILATIKPFFCNQHAHWWEETGLIYATGEVSEFNLDEMIFREELLVSMFRLYITSPALIEFLLNHVFLNASSESPDVTKIKLEINETIIEFQIAFRIHCLGLFRNEILRAKLPEIYLSYIQDLRDFTLYPIGRVDKTELTAFEHYSCEKAQETGLMHELFPEEKLQAISGGIAPIAEEGTRIQLNRPRATSYRDLSETISTAASEAPANDSKKARRYSFSSDH